VRIDGSIRTRQVRIGRLSRAVRSGQGGERGAGYGRIGRRDQQVGQGGTKRVDGRRDWARGDLAVGLGRRVKMLEDGLYTYRCRCWSLPDCYRRRCASALWKGASLF
jgi:hypothetical protein